VWHHLGKELAVVCLRVGDGRRVLGFVEGVAALVLLPQTVDDEEDEEHGTEKADRYPSDDSYNGDQSHEIIIQ